MGPYQSASMTVGIIIMPSPPRAGLSHSWLRTLISLPDCGAKQEHTRERAGLRHGMRQCSSFTKGLSEKHFKELSGKGDRCPEAVFGWHDRRGDRGAPLLPSPPTRRNHGRDILSGLSGRLIAQQRDGFEDFAAGDMADETALHEDGKIAVG